MKVFYRWDGGYVSSWMEGGGESGVGFGKIGSMGRFGLVGVRELAMRNEAISCYVLGYPM